ncbi:MAG: hypothetical protein KF758_16940 [Anaerolineales bacterium]|nr:hypothetical protein [Anaerolineales bacterium]
MDRIRKGLFLFLLLIFLCASAIPTHAAPHYALALNEGRTYDQAHDQGYIDWSAPAQYVYIQHRDGSSLPPNEGGTFCGSGCWEWVTRLGNGGVASGAFSRNVAYFEVMVGFTPDSNVGTAVLRACASVKSWPLQTGSGLPGFVSMDLSVPSGCRSWSLTASGGYVDFRSIDVIYSGPPPTATPTFTPTMTPTLTYTPTPSFTPTFTATPTPLPPSITGHVICDLWGNAGWCKGNASLELTAGDPQGLDVFISGDLNGASFSCGGTCSLPLDEGLGVANYLVTSLSGRTASGSSTWQRDSTPPQIDLNLPAIDGENGWYISPVEVLAEANDLTSGLEVLNGRMDPDSTWNSFPLHLEDGIHQVTAHAGDMAGNEAFFSETIRIDTVSPIAQITSHSNGEVVQGRVLLTGKHHDETSGIGGGEISTDGGVNWQAVLINNETDWEYPWHSNEVPNGEYSLLMRAIDQAGNIGEPDVVSLVVSNAPPSVSITERWWIWEEGLLKVHRNHFPIESVQVTIQDPQNRWAEVVMELNPNRSNFSISWDRRFADGTVAPSGEYPVVAIACDVHGLCGRDTGTILIPIVSTATPSVTPSRTMTNTATPSATFVGTQIPPTSTSVLMESSVTEIPVQVAFPFWQMIGLVGLFMAIASASVVDSRPAALDRLRESIKLISKQNNQD